MIWQHIAFFVYLCQSLLGTLIYLQFEDVDCIWHVHHGISPADGALYLCADIDVEEAEHCCQNGEGSHNEESMS